MTQPPVKIKTEFKPKSYVVNFTPKQIISTFAKIRCRILPLGIETGRFVNCKEEDRICELCNIKVENEQHFICTCPPYKKERNNMYKHVNIPNFNAVTVIDKCIILMKSEQNKVGKFNSLGIAIKLDNQSYSHKHRKIQLELQSN